MEGVIGRDSSTNIDTNYSHIYAANSSTNLIPVKINPNSNINNNPNLSFYDNSVIYGDRTNLLNYPLNLLILDLLFFHLYMLHEHLHKFY